MFSKQFLIPALVTIMALTACGNGEKPEFSGNITDKVYLKRDKSDNLSVVVMTPGKWRIYMGTRPDSINFNHPFAEGKQPGEFQLDVDSSNPHYFQVITTEGKAVLGESHLPLKGGYNFRDLGGIRTIKGRYTRWGKVFRSDELTHLTQGDLEYLAKIPIVSVVDFRSAAEMDEAPDRNPSTVVNNYKLSITPGNLESLDPGAIDELTEEQGDSIMKAINRQLVSDPAAIQQYKRFFQLLSDEENIPLLYHCTAGKDRTGMATFLFLYALGVDEYTIMDNYLASNDYLKDKYGPYVKMIPALEPLVTVKPGYLKAGVDEIVKEHGSIEDFLKKTLDVDISKLQRLYLY